MAFMVCMVHSPAAEIWHKFDVSTTYTIFATSFK